MLNKSFVDPKRIVVVGGSDNVQKPGGKVLYNLMDGRFTGEVCVINPKHKSVQGCRSFSKPEQIENDVDLAILAIPARFCLDSIKSLHTSSHTKSFIIISAGFSETDTAGASMEKELRDYASENGIQIYGPNCTGIVTRHYSGAFTTPIPEVSDQGVDLVSSSGATAVFLMEQGILQGMRFENVFSVGNAMMISVEDILEHLDTIYNEGIKKVILLYIETIKNPQKLYKHALALSKKGCRLVALKAGRTEAGNMAAASHTGAISNSFDAVEALFRKARIISCSSRNELINVALVSLQKKMPGKNIAVVTHAGGPGVMATDALERGGFTLHQPCKTVSETLKEHLPDGASVGNPFDILATGGVRELSYVMQYIKESKCYDGVIVIFGSPGLSDEQEVFAYLSEEMAKSALPVFLVIPSPINAKKEIAYWIETQNYFFTDETSLVEAMTRATLSQEYPESAYEKPQSEAGRKDELLPQLLTDHWLGSVGLQFTDELHTDDQEQMLAFLDQHRPVVIKATELVHKTEYGGVKLDIRTANELAEAIEQLSELNGKNFTLQKQVSGFDIYLGVQYDEVFGHIIYFGKGGIHLEVEKDIEKALYPLKYDEVRYLLEKLKIAPVWKGTRNQKGIDLDKLTLEILKLNDLLSVHPEIRELDINPMICSEGVSAIVDARIVI